jgi:cation:H+ antiporter
MEGSLHVWYSTLHPALLALVIIVCLAVLGKAADWLVDEAVVLSERSGIPKTVIGATVVSLGTTMPETAVSVLAALQGSPALALGNAVGSIICDTGLILGLASVIAPLRLDPKVVRQQGWIQFGSGWLLVAACFPWTTPALVFSAGGRLTQLTGVIFLVALAAYLWQSIRWSREQKILIAEVEAHEKDAATALPIVVGKLVVAVGLVVLSAHVLIPAVAEAARRMAIPESIIAATLVAFGTSLPELVTAVTSAWRGHGELAVGNIIGADILNVLFVSGAAAAATPAGLEAGSHFFLVLFPVMLFVLAVFRIGIYFSGEAMGRPFGLVLLVTYAIYTAVSFLLPADAVSQ